MNDYHLPEKYLKILRIAHKGMRDKNKADRIKAVYLLGSGWKVSSVHEALMIDENTIRNYFARYKDSDLMGLLDDQYVVNKGLLGKQEQVDLELHLEEVVYRTSKEVVDFIKREYEVDYSISGVHRLLKRLGFVYKKPQRVPGKYDAQAQAKFIEKYRKISRNLGPSDHLCFMDTTHPQHETIAGYGWMKKGRSQVLATTAKQPRLNISGVLDIKKLEVITHFQKEMINKESAQDMLGQLRRAKPEGWIHLILDRAGYYNNDEVREWAKSLAIKLHYLPAYSPNLNLIERVWLYFKKMTLQNKFYKSFAEFEAACRTFFKDLPAQKEALATLLTEKFQRFSVA